VVAAIERVCIEDGLSAASRRHLDPALREAMQDRCLWVVNNPDIVATLHAVRVEVLMHYGMSNVVPPENGRPFLHWLRFEWGSNGNPHAHGLCYVAGNPHFDAVVKDAEERQRFIAAGHPDAFDMRSREEAELDCGRFYIQYVSEKHPSKNVIGEESYNYWEDIITSSLQKPQCVNVMQLLSDVLEPVDAQCAAEPDFTELKKLLLAIVEAGQRHDMHGHNPHPSSMMQCARQRGSSTYCRYLFPRKVRLPDASRPGEVREDPYRAGLRNLFLERNDQLLNNFEAHLLLSNVGNIDWRPFINLWSVLEYLTKYTTKAGKGSKALGRVLVEVLDKIFDWETEDGIHDLWRRTIMNTILGFPIKNLIQHFN
jgi:hypothetical protein